MVGFGTSLPGGDKMEYEVTRVAMLKNYVHEADEFAFVVKIKHAVVLGAVSYAVLATIIWSFV